MGPRICVLDGGVTLAPPGEYDRSMCAAMRAVAYSTAAACFIIGFISPIVAPDWAGSGKENLWR